MNQFRPTDYLLNTPYDAAWFEMVFNALDSLHDTVSANELEDNSPMAPAEMVGWLEDVIYTAQEIIAELKARREYVTETGPAGLESEVCYVRFDLN
ncbi:MAG: hypothetical protein EHM35_14615 [Planctomycetaceae bacterium]|nr:MAG: hypothetical protein EHM35_14615 [Planctomycetaceae bacterium]